MSIFEFETELEINKELVLSTCHICKETSERLSKIDKGDLLESDLFIDEYQEGWRILVPTDLASHDFGIVPGDLVLLLLLAKENDCKWLVLDCDGLEVAGLPVHTW